MKGSRTRQWVLLLAVVAVAAFLRLYRIDRLPPAAGFDQAAYGTEIYAILDGARPVFFETRHGREAMFSYLATLVYLAVGDAALAVYVTSALVGIATVPAVYLAAREMLAGEGGAVARWGPLLAALTLALSHWHLSWSRLGMRVVLVPTFCALAAWALWRGFRTGSAWVYAVAGAFLGLGMYTYQAFRIFPLVVVAACLYRGWRRRGTVQGMRYHVVRLALVTVAALVVFAPLGIHFLTHPTSATRIVGVAIVTEEGREWRENARILFEQAIKVPRTLFWRGDDDPRVTVAGRPALNPFLAAAFAGGLILTLLRARRPLYLTLLVWLVLMSVPAALAGGGAITKRAYGTMPAVAILIAVAPLALWDASRRPRWQGEPRLLQSHPGICHCEPPKAMKQSPADIRRDRSPALHAALVAVLAAVLAAGYLYTGVRTYVDYFVTWARDPHLFTHFEAGTAALGSYLATLPAGERVYLSPTPADHPAIEVYSGMRPGLKTYHGRHCLVVPGRVEEGITYVVVPAEDDISLDLLPPVFPGGTVADRGPLHLGQPYYISYRVPAVAAQAEPEKAPRIAPRWPADVAWEGLIGLLGYDLDAAGRRYVQGDKVALTVYLQGRSEMSLGYTAFAQLLGPHNPASDGPLWAQDDSEPCRGVYATWAWDVGEIVIDHYTLRVPEAAPPGRYQIALGFYDWRTMERLAVGGDPLAASGAETADGPIASDVRRAADHVLLGEIEVVAR
jgi:hypothetical protein